MIYTGGEKLLTRKDLHGIDIPEREDVSPIWKGVNHGVLADAVVNYVNKVGFRVSKETWYTNPNGNRLFGAVDLDTKGTDFELKIGQDANYCIGVRHDNGGNYSVSLAMGARVTVCSNGVFSGDYVLKHKHTTKLDIYDMVGAGIEEWMSETSKMDNFIRMMQSVDLEDKDATYLAILTAEQIRPEDAGCVTWVHVQKVLQKWYWPPHEEFAPRTLWSLYNAFTETAKEMTPPRQDRLLRGLKTRIDTFVKEEVGL